MGQRRGSLAARGPYDLNDVQGCGLGRGGEASFYGGRVLWGGGANFENRPSHHKYKSPKQFL